MKIGIIGGAGFIGCNLAKHYLDKKDSVTIFDNFSRKGSKENVNWLKKSHPKNLRVLQGDIRTDLDKLENMVNEVQIIYHMAAQVAVTTSLNNPREDFEINALGTFNVLEVIRSSRTKPCLIYASTNKVYGRMTDIQVSEGQSRWEYKNQAEEISEERPVDFYSPYGCSKGCGEQYVRDYARIYGLRTVVFRQSCIYGEKQFGVEDQGWIAWFVIAALLGKPITIYGDGKQIRDILYIKDLIEAFELAVRKIDITRGEIYNIGGGNANTMSPLELITYLEELLKEKIFYSFAGWREGDQLVYISDVRKAEGEFGWRPKTKPSEGIKKLVEWVRTHRAEVEGQTSK